MANEKRLIDAARLRFEVNRFLRNDGKVRDEVDSLICMMPTVDAVEVVRCKDCKHYYYSDFSESMRCRLDGVQYEKDDFCSKGKRKPKSGTKCTPVEVESIDFDYEAED